MPAAFFSLLLLLVLRIGKVLTEDMTLLDRANGESVVLSTIEKIQASCIFPEDYEFMRRIAWVESKDGTDANTFTKPNGKGIWQVDQIGFKDTKNIQSYSTLGAKHRDIKSKLSIDWMEVSYDDLNKPLYCALAARLLLSNKPDSVPVGLTDQASYWKTHYNSVSGTGTADKFISDVTAMESKQRYCERPALDIVFVIDSSGSIGSDNFESVRHFMSSTVNFFDIGRDKVRIGAVQFSTGAQVEFHFNQYNTASAVRDAIGRIQYLRGGTNTAEGIDLMRNNVFLESNGARPTSEGVPRVGILFTDGQSNDRMAVVRAANQTHAASIRMFAIGVGSINEDELNIIASNPACLHMFRLSRFSEITPFANKLKRLTCKSSTIISKIQTNVTGNLQMDDSAYYEAPVPSDDGVTVKCVVDEGKVNIYASRRYPNPSKALHDQKATAEPSKPAHIFCPGNRAPTRRKRDASGISASNNTQAVFLTIQALQNNTKYAMYLAEGNQVPVPTSSTTQSVSVAMQAEMNQMPNAATRIQGTPSKSDLLMLLIVIPALMHLFQ